MARREILICNGSHCRKALGRDGSLERAIAELPLKVTRVGCQKVCRGPVVGLAFDGRWQWFERMSSKKALRALSTAVEDGQIPKPLRKRRNAKRAGRLRS